MQSTFKIILMIFLFRRKAHSYYFFLCYNFSIKTRFWLAYSLKSEKYRIQLDFFFMITPHFHYSTENSENRRYEMLHFATVLNSSTIPIDRSKWKLYIICRIGRYRSNQCASTLWKNLALYQTNRIRILYRFRKLALHFQSSFNQKEKVFSDNKVNILQSSKLLWSR